MQLLNARVKYPIDRTRNTEYGIRVKLVATLTSGIDIELWDTPPSVLQTLKKNEEIKVLYDGKKYTYLNESAPAEPAPEPIRPPTPSPEIRAIANGLSEDVKEWLQIYSEFEQARPDLSVETKRAATNTIFMTRMQVAERM